MSTRGRVPLRAVQHKGKIAFVFPGQGSQVVGMGKLVYEACAAARAVFEEADAVLGEALSTLCFEGPEEALRLTANTQPALVASSIATLALLDVVPDVVAGHSLGEYSAHVAAGTLSFADAVKLVRQRGEYMQDAVPVGAGAMAAILKADAYTVERTCAETEGVVEPANYNCPGQIVIAGETTAVHAASAALNDSGARALPLPVSAPFHSSLMKPAEERLAADIRVVSFTDPSVPVYVNVDAAPVRTAAAARDALVRQVSRAVRWEQSVQRMIQDGVTLFVEVGPGKVLTGMIRRISKEIGHIHVSEPNDLEAARAAIAKHAAAAV